MRVFKPDYSKPDSFRVCLPGSGHVEDGLANRLAFGTREAFFITARENAQRGERIPAAQETLWEALIGNGGMMVHKDEEEMARNM